MSIYERGETYAQHEEIRDRDGVLSDPSSVSMTITDPCGVTLVNLQALTKDDTGKYHYYYAISSNAVYGEYKTLVVAIDGAGNEARWSNSFHVLPWDCIREIRLKSGVEQEKSISDDDIGTIVWDAYTEVLNEIYEHHDYESFVYDPDVNVLFNGTNTTVRIDNDTPLADSNGDGAITGWGEQSCGTDIDGYWIDSDYAKHQLKITLVDDVTGRCTVTQTDGTAIPSTHEGVYVTYWTRWHTWNERLLRKAVVYLAAHEISQRFHETDRATLVDLDSNREILLANPKRLEKLYTKAKDKIRKPMFGGTR